MTAPRSVSGDLPTCCARSTSFVDYRLLIFEIHKRVTIFAPESNRERLLVVTHVRLQAGTGRIANSVPRLCRFYGRWHFPRLFNGCGHSRFAGPQQNSLMQTTELLVIGAGPFGLAVAAHARLSGIGVTVVGEPMAFWKHNMPGGMLLRSGLEWHLDAAGVHTLESFLEEKHISRADVQPLPVEIFREYADWFRESKKITVQPLRIKRLRRVDGHFEAECDRGEVIRANRVVATPGLAPFVNMPAEISASLSADRVAHTATLVDFRSLAGKRCLIVGGRQSAFEWAALIAEAAAESVDLVFRHDTPRFVTSDWSFTDSMIASM